MKKIIILLICISFMFSATTAFATDTATVFVNGEEVVFDSKPVIVDSRTLVPVRAVLEKMGAEVTWFEEYQMICIVRNDTKVILQVNSDIMKVSHENVFSYSEYEKANKITLDVAPAVIENRTMLPIRAVAESFGGEVFWNNEENRVDIICSVERNKDVAYADMLYRYLLFGNGEDDKTVAYVFTADAFGHDEKILKLMNLRLLKAGYNGFVVSDRSNHYEVRITYGGAMNKEYALKIFGSQNISDILGDGYDYPCSISLLDIMEA